MKVSGREKAFRAYEEIEHPSDIGLRFRGESLEELFANAGVGMFSLITDIKRVRPAENIEVQMASAEGSSLEDILVTWLEKLLYYFEVEKILISGIRVKELAVGKDGIRLNATLSGERMDIGRYDVSKMIKAPTYHMLGIHRSGRSGIWEGTVIFDV